MFQVAGDMLYGATVHGQRGGLEIGFMHIWLLNGSHMKTQMLNVSLNFKS